MTVDDLVKGPENPTGVMEEPSIFRSCITANINDAIGSDLGYESFCNSRFDYHSKWN